MTFPAVDLYPGPDLFPGSPLPVVVGGYSQPVEIALNGLILTATDEFGVDWVAEVLTGWFGSAGSTLQLTPRLRSPGGWPSPRQLDSLPVTVAGFVEAPSADALTDALARLNAAVTLSGAVLTVSRSGTTRSRIVYRQGPPTISIAGDTTAIWSLDLVAADPRLFASTLTGSTALPATTGGLILPLILPLFLGSTVVSGSCHLASPGTYPGPLLLRIDGPCNGPQVTHVSSGRALEFHSDLSLAAGQWLVVDMEGQSVLANGDLNASRAMFVTADSSFFSFDPGDNEFAFTAATYDPGSELTVYGTPAWY